MTIPNIGENITLYIEGMDDEGRGRGVIDKDDYTIDVAVRGAFPGDKVSAIVERVFSNRRLLVCHTAQYHKKGPAHIERTCPHQGPCPACPLHEADLSIAFEIKRGRIERALLDQNIDLEIENVVPHPKIFGYRQKVKLMVGGHTGNIVIGVYIPYSHKLVSATACPYLHVSLREAIAPLLQTLNTQRFEVDTALNPGLRALILRAGVEGVAVILVSRKAISAPQFMSLQNLVDSHILHSVCERVDDKDTNSILGGITHLCYGNKLITPLDGGPAVDADSFCQTDPEQANLMYKIVANYLTKETNNGFFIDGYAGVGGFSKALLALGVQNIIAVEQASSCLSSLQQLGVQIYIKSMEDIPLLLSHVFPVNGMVIDPPKKGLTRQAEPLAQLQIPRVVLVSCDPDAMAKDLKIFLHYGYQVDQILPIDFFGGTPAIETIVSMKLSAIN
jgi:23S rRNA (uracil1939-C5)-methyltransferase